MKGWTSVRNSWPTSPGVYKVWDCRKDIKTKLEYDGMNFAQSIIKYQGSGQGSFQVTHWKDFVVHEIFLNHEKNTPPQQ